MALRCWADSGGIDGSDGVAVGQSPAACAIIEPVTLGKRRWMSWRAIASIGCDKTKASILHPSFLCVSSAMTFHLLLTMPIPRATLTRQRRRLGFLRQGKA